MVLASDVLEKLHEVIDPELYMSIVDLGLIYDVKIKKDQTVNILMTLTTLGCPLYETIEDEIYLKLESLGLLKEKIKIKLTFDPPWSMDLMSERARAMLGI